MKRMFSSIQAGMLVAIAAFGVGVEPVHAQSRNSVLDCQDFVNHAMDAAQKYYARGCPASGYMHYDRDGHFNWCMAKSPVQVREDRNAKSELLRICLIGRWR